MVLPRRAVEESGWANVTVPYRENRLVMFDSALFHKTDSFEFKPGFLVSCPPAALHIHSQIALRASGCSYCVLCSSCLPCRCSSASSAACVTLSVWRCTSPGEQNRRINLTLLFGKMDLSAAAAQACPLDS